MPDSSAGGVTPPPCTAYKTDFFYPANDSRRADQPNAVERMALRVCAGCPLASRKACLEAELRFPSHKQYGVFGGATAAQRRAILAARARRAAKLAELAELAGVA
jgi:WhiB family redox-sensing transcriptional regulator